MPASSVTVVLNYRSPFCALIIDRIFALPRRYGVEIDWRIVSEVPRPSSLPITEDNPRFSYNREDCRRRYGWRQVPWNPPAWRLTGVVDASRLGQWLLQTRSPFFQAFTERVIRAYWSHGLNISDAAVVKQIARDVGIPESDLQAAADATTDLDRVLQENKEWCQKNGILGAPFFIVGNERFWGSDRIDALELTLSEQGRGPRPYDADGSILFAEPAPTLPVAGSEARVAVGRIFCVGRNYADHAREMGKDPTREPPFFFMKPSDSIVPSDRSIPYPPETSNYHYEMELVVVIGKPAFAVSPETAEDVVFGYAAGLDMTRRDLQLAARDKGRPWETGKSFEQSAIVGAVRPASDLASAPLGEISLTVNGTLKQKATVADMIWSVPEIIANLSRFYHLKPGDVIFTGTPAGVGPVVPGDKLSGSIADVGTVTADIVAATP